MSCEENNIIYTGQPIPCKTTISDVNGVVNMTSNTLKFYYFFPGNITDTPDGNVDGDVSAGINGLVTGLIPSSANTLAGQFKIQAIPIVTSEEWPARTLKTLEVLKRGD